MSKFDHLSGNEPHVQPEPSDERPVCIGCGEKLVPYPGVGMGCPSKHCDAWDIRLDMNGRKD